MKFGAKDAICDAGVNTLFGEAGHRIHEGSIPIVAKRLNIIRARLKVAEALAKERT